MRRLMHVETLDELSSTEDAVKESQLKFAALEELIQRLEEKDQSHQRELKEKEETMNKMVEEEHGRELEKVQEKLDEELQRKEDYLRQ